MLTERNTAADIAISNGGDIRNHVKYGGEAFQEFMAWTCETYQPLNTSENKHFRNFMLKLNPKAQVYDRHTVTSKLGDQAAVVKATLKKVLQNQYYALTCDHWSSVAGTSYMGATVHFIDTDWSLISFTLNCNEHSGSSDAPESLRVLTEAYEAYELSHLNLVGVVTDTAPVMGYFGRLLPADVPHFYCVDHVMELTTGFAFHLAEANNLMVRVRALIGHFSSSNQAMEALLSLQSRRDPSWRPKKVIQDVRTRWWSTYVAIERLIVLKPYLNILEVEGHLKCNLEDEDWEILREVESLLQPFMIVQKILEGQQYVTMSLVPYFISKARGGLRTVATTARSEVIRRLANKMLTDDVKGFNTYWGEGVDGTVFEENSTLSRANRQKGLKTSTLLAAVLDPRTKTLNGIGPLDKASLMEELKLQMISLKTELNRGQIDDVNQIVPPSVQAAEIDDIFSDIAVDTDMTAGIADAREPLAVEREVMAELKDYTKLAVLPIKYTSALNEVKFNNPLAWWRDNCRQFPLLSILARRLLCIPATSAPTERVFSTAGLTISNSRASILPQNASNLIFLHDSWPVAREYDAKQQKSTAPSAL